jgi:hypothetical protein
LQGEGKILLLLHPTKRSTQKLLCETEVCNRKVEYSIPVSSRKSRLLWSTADLDLSFPWAGDLWLGLTTMN